MTATDLAEQRDHMAQMAAAWESLCTDATAGLIAGWRLDVRRMIGSRDRLVRAVRWTTGAPDVLGVLQRRDSELAQSRLLAWALDPVQAHGLGTGLLELIFSEVLGREPAADVAQARCRLEVRHVDTIADVVVEGPSFSIVVENKVGAPPSGVDQPGRLQARWRDSDLVWLSITGEVPPDALPDRWTGLSYERLHNLLGRAIDGSPEASTGVRDWHASLQPQRMRRRR